MPALGTSEKLLDFFRKEFQVEARSGFPRLSRVPSTYVIAVLSHYRSLTEADQLAFADCSAHWAHAAYGFLIGAPAFDHTKHPYYRQWSHSFGTHYASTRRSVPSLRAMVQQYKIDAQKGAQSSISQREFQDAASVLDRVTRAPELRLRVRDALQPHGYYRKDHFGYWCRRDGREFCVHVSFGGARAHHQLQYGIARPGLCPEPFCSFESALGFVMGNSWDFLVQENVDDSLCLFTDLVDYSYALPDRIRAEAA